MYQKIVKKIGDNHLFDAIKITTASALPFLFFHTKETFPIAFTLSMGAMLTAPVDIPSSLKHKVIGLLLGSFTIAAITLVLGTVVHFPWIFYPVFATVIFSISMIGVYGQRANLLSFTGLLSISLAFIHNYEGKELLMNCLLLFAGGMVYLGVSLLFYFIRPNRYINIEIANAIEITAEYLDLRAALWSSSADRDHIAKEQLNLQVKLNELHESIREYLIHNKAHTYNTDYNRKFLVTLSSLIDMMELTNAHVFDHEHIRYLFRNDLQLVDEYQKLAEHMATTLHSLSYHIKANKKYHSPVQLNKDFNALKTHFQTFSQLSELPHHSEEISIFSNVLHYAEKQIEKIKGLERVYKGRVNADELGGKYKHLEKFLTPQHYRLSILRENLNASSMIFRHSTRLTITLLLGFILGKLLPLQNEYWILMTMVVIMRPGYGLTKQRSKERVLGTIFGGFLAFAFLYFIPNTPFLVVLTILSMIVGYWFSYSQYKIGVTFITMYVVLIYGMLTPNYESLLVYRVIDTAIGAFMAFCTTHLLWPSWEFLKIKTYLKESLSAIKGYVFEIKKYYNEKGEPTLSYKLARKHAFIEVGNLMASFQRMVQEPKSKQKNKAELYELAVLNQTLVSAAASIGTYVQSHETTEASQAFNSVMNKVMENLETSLLLFDKNYTVTLTEKDEDFELSFAQLKNMRLQELDSSLLDEQKKKQLLEESQLVIDQLIWMVSISEKIVKISTKIKIEKQKTKHKNVVVSV